MTGKEDGADEVRILAARAAACASAAWRVVADAATVPALRRTAVWAVKCHEHAIHAVTWAATAHEYGGAAAGSPRMAQAGAAARKEAALAEEMLRAAEAAAHGGGGPSGPRRARRPRGKA